MVGEGRKLHSKVLNLYSPNIVRVIKSRRMRWVGHVERMGRGAVCTGFWWRNLRKRDHLEDPGVGERLISKMDLQEVGWGSWTGMIWLRIGTGGGHLLMR